MTDQARSAVGSPPTGWMARSACALWGRRLTLATIILVLPMAVANRMTHDPAALTSPAHVEAVRAADRALADGRDLLVWNDPSSYYAMASPDRATSYLAHRPPFAYRVLVPTVARWLSPWLGVLGAFGVLGVLGYVAAVLAVHQIFLAMRYTREAADLGASLFALVPYAVTPILDPVLVDAGAWALTLWAWWAWLSGRSVVSAALLGGAVLCRETSLLLVPCIAHHGWRHRVPWSRISGVVMTAGVALLLPRLLIEPAFALDLTSLMKIVVRHKVRMWTEPRGFAIGFLESTAYGLGLGSLLLPLAWREVMRPPLVYSAWLLVAFGAVTTFVSLEIGRLLVTASLVVAGAAVAYLARLPPGLRRVATVVLLGGGLVVTAAWCYGRGASRAVAVAWFALGVVLCLAYRRGRLLAPEAAAMRARGPSSGGPAGAD